EDLFAVTPNAADRLAQDEPVREAEVAAVSPETPETTEASPRPEKEAPHSREDFIAAARRAARQANKQPQRDLPTAPTPPPIATAEAALAAINGKGKPAVRPALVVVCLGALLIAGSVLLFGSSFRPLSIFAKSERPALPSDKDPPSAKDGRGASATPP